MGIPQWFKDLRGVRMFGLGADGQPHEVNVAKLPSGDIAGLVSAGFPVSITFSDTTYDYYGSAPAGSKTTDLAWIITRIEKAARKGTVYAGLVTRVDAVEANIPGHQYNNGVIL